MKKLSCNYNFKITKIVIIILFFSITIVLNLYLSRIKKLLKEKRQELLYSKIPYKGD